MCTVCYSLCLLPTYSADVTATPTAGSGTNDNTFLANNVFIVAVAVLFVFIVAIIVGVWICFACYMRRIDTDAKRGGVKLGSNHHQGHHLSRRIKNFIRSEVTKQSRSRLRSTAEVCIVILIQLCIMCYIM